MPPVFTAQQQQILDSFTGKIRPVRVSFGYGLALSLVAMLMVLLPLLYLGFVATVGWWWCWYLMHGHSLLGSARSFREFELVALVYLGPLFVGAILVIFMFKPLLARPPAQARPISLDERRERFLFAFIRRLCAAVGAPEPRRIDIACDVNASASFRRGVLSLFGNDLVLTIGLPLVAGQNLRQFSGVLAHEFGHFAQGWAMRASYLIHAVNRWFARVVYQRDALDEWLQEQAEDDSHLAIKFVMYVAAIFVWITRGVLFVLMMVGHAISSLLSRHMEFDADRHAFRLVGREPFSSALRELPLLGAAEAVAYAGLAEAWKNRRIADDFPRLVSTGVTLIPPDARTQLIDEGLRHSGGMYASHPPTRDRIRAAESDQDAGVFAGADLPAHVLFSDFSEVCRSATINWYREEVGLEVKPEHLVSTHELTASKTQEATLVQQSERFLGRLWSGTTFFAPMGVPTPVRDQDGLMKDADSADEWIVELKRRQTLVAAGIEKSGDQGNGLQAAQQRRALVRTRIARAAAAMQTKLAAAQGTEADQLRACLSHLATMQAGVDDLREGFVVLLALLQHLEFRGEEAAYKQALQQALRQQSEQLATVRAAAVGQPYPFEHEQAGMSLAEWLVAKVPSDHDLAAVMETSHQVLEACFALHQRILGQLVNLTVGASGTNTHERSPATGAETRSTPRRSAASMAGSV